MSGGRKGKKKELKKLFFPRSFVIFNFSQQKKRIIIIKQKFLACFGINYFHAKEHNLLNVKKLP